MASGQDYTIRISTPSDVRGAERTAASLKNIEVGAATAGAQIASLDAATANLTFGHVSAGTAARIQAGTIDGLTDATREAATAVTSLDAAQTGAQVSAEAGATASANAAKSVQALAEQQERAAASAGGLTNSLQQWMQAASSAPTSLGGLLGQLGNLTPAAFAAAAAAGALKVGWDEMAENERAHVVLTKFGRTAKDLEQHAQVLEGLEFVTEDKIAAVQLFGRVMAGNTRQLAMYGIELEADATLQERFNALMQLAGRGFEIKKTMAETTTGTMSLMWKETKDFLGEGMQDFVDFAGKAAQVQGLLGGLGKPLAATAGLIERMIGKGKENPFAAQMKGAEGLRKEVDASAAQAKIAERYWLSLARALDEVRDAAGRAKDSLDSILADSVADAETDEKGVPWGVREADVDTQEASGQMTANQAEQARLNLRNEREGVQNQAAQGRQATKEIDAALRRRGNDDEYKTLLYSAQGFEDAGAPVPSDLVERMRQNRAEGEALEKERNQISREGIALSRKDQTERARLVADQARLDAKIKADAERDKPKPEPAPKPAAAAPVRDDSAALALAAKAAEIAKVANPEPRRDLLALGAKVRSGKGSEADITALQDAADDVLEKRKGLKGKRGEEAAADQAELKKLAEEAKKAAAAAAQLAPAIKQSMTQVATGLSDARKAIEDVKVAMDAGKRRAQGAN